MTGASGAIKASGDFKTAAKGSKARDRRPAPISIRFNEAELALLSECAKGDALGPYIKRYVLDRHRAMGTAKRKPLSKQQEAIARALRGLGKSGLSNVLGTLLLAVEEGRLPIERHEEAELRRAVADVAAIREGLVAALNIRECKQR